MVESVVSYFEKLAWAPEIIIIILAMMPIIELRGAIPAGIFLLKLPIWYVFVVSVIANILIIPLILYSLAYLEKKLVKKSWGQRAFEAFNKHIRTKHTKKIERFKLAALFIFVAIPLPGTGAWTGSFIAYVFNLPRKQSIAYISLGVLTAGVLVTLMSTGIVQLMR